MWPFVLEHHVTSSRQLVLSVPFIEALAVVQDPETVINLNPLLLKKEKHNDDPLCYTITDKLRLLGLWDTTTTFTCKFVVHDDGLESNVEAGVGTKLKGQWSLRKTEAGMELIENTKVTVSKLHKAWVLTAIS